MRVNTSLLLCASLCLAACGGSTKPAEEPSSEAPSKRADSKEKESASDKSEASSESEAKTDDKKSESKKSEAKAEESSTEGPKITRTAKDIVTAPDIIFMFSWNSSDVKDRAEKTCGGDDPKKHAQCMDKEKKKIELDGMSFKQEKGSWYWLWIHRKGKTLVNLHKLPIEFGKEDEHSIVLKPSGKDEGKLRAGAPGETKLEVPNEYQIVYSDPKLGKMVFDAKIGLTGQ